MSKECKEGKDCMHSRTIALTGIIILAGIFFYHPVYGEPLTSKNPLSENPDYSTGQTFQLPQVSRQLTSITIQASQSSVTIGTSITFSGKLTDQSGTGIPNGIVLIKEDGCSVNCTLVTGLADQSGSYSLTWNSDRAGTISIFASFAGSLRYQGSSSGDITIQVNSLAQQPSPPTPSPVPVRTPTMLSLQSSASTVTKGDTLTFSGKLIDNAGNKIAYTTIRIIMYDERDAQLHSIPVTTDSYGTFSQNWTSDVSGTVKVAAVFDGSFQYTGSTSPILTLYVKLLQLTSPPSLPPPQSPPSSPQPSPSSHPPPSQPIIIPRTPTILSLQSSSNTANKGDTITFSGQLTDNAGNAIVNEPIRIVIYDIRNYYQSHELRTVTDSFGNFNQSWVADVSGTLVVKALFVGSPNYDASTSNTISLYVSLLKPMPPALSTPPRSPTLPVTASRVVSITQGSGADQNCAVAGNCYSPDQITVSVGHTIVWKNDDSVSHTVTSGLPSENNTGNIFDSGLILPGSSYSFTFNRAGTFHYYDNVHPWITGEVIVQQNALNIPGWIKNNARWWAEDQIGDAEFVKAVQYLIQQGVMTVPQTQTASSANSTQQMPFWIKKDAGWWAAGQLPDDDFVKAIQYLISQGIVKTQ